MKNLLKIGVFALYALCMMLDVSCLPVDLEVSRPSDSSSNSSKSDTTSSNSDTTNYLNSRIVTKTQSLNANATKKGESYTKTYTLKIDDLFKDATGFTDLSQVRSVYVRSFKVEFDQANCANLDNYLVEANFPVFGKLTNSDCSQATDFGESTNFGKAVKNTNLAEAIKKGESITVTFTMKAKEDIPAGVGVTINTELSMTFSN